MGCGQSRVNEDVFDKEYRICQKKLRELEQHISKIEGNKDIMTPKKIAEISKKRELLSQYDMEIGKSIEILNKYFATNDVVIAAGKTDKMAKVVECTNNWQNLKTKINYLNMMANSNHKMSDDLNPPMTEAPEVMQMQI